MAMIENMMMRKNEIQGDGSGNLNFNWGIWASGKTIGQVIIHTHTCVFVSYVRVFAVDDFSFNWDILGTEITWLLMGICMYLYLSLSSKTYF